MARSTVGAQIDKLWKLKLEVDKISGQLAKIKMKKQTLEDDILRGFTKDEIDSVKGRTAKVSIVRTVVPQVADSEAFFKYVKKTKSFDLLQKRISTAAFRERISTGKIIPGIETFTRVSLRLTKV